jgi:hypothetical protein
MSLTHERKNEKGQAKTAWGEPAKKITAAAGTFSTCRPS